MEGDYVKEFTSEINFKINNGIDDAIIKIVKGYNPIKDAYEFDYEINAEMIRQALDKQRPKKPYTNDDGYLGPNCPACGKNHYNFAYCPHCGQKIDWGCLQ